MPRKWEDDRSPGRDVNTRVWKPQPVGYRATGPRGEPPAWYFETRDGRVYASDNPYWIDDDLARPKNKNDNPHAREVFAVDGRYAAADDDDGDESDTWWEVPGDHDDDGSSPATPTPDRHSWDGAVHHDRSGRRPHHRRNGGDGTNAQSDTTGGRTHGPKTFAEMMLPEGAEERSSWDSVHGVMVWGAAGCRSLWGRARREWDDLRDVVRQQVAAHGQPAYDGSDMPRRPARSVTGWPYEYEEKWRNRGRTVSYPGTSYPRTPHARMSYARTSHPRRAPAYGRPASRSGYVRVDSDEKA